VICLHMMQGFRVVTRNDDGWGIVMSRSCNFRTGWFVCFVGGERRIMISAGRLVGASGMSPIGSMTAS
jgi:hypothetical protein